MVKRSLPRSGAYDLERLISNLYGHILIPCLYCHVYRYMPVYLWKDRMKRMGLDPFNELLKLVAARQNNDPDDIEVLSHKLHLFVLHVCISF